MFFMLFGDWYFQGEDGYNQGPFDSQKEAKDVFSRIGT